VGAGLTCQRPIITSGDERIRAATGAHRDSLCLIQAMAGLGARAHWFGRCSVRMDLPWNIKQCHGEYFSLEPYKLIFTFLCVVDILFVDVPYFNEQNFRMHSRKSSDFLSRARERIAVVGTVRRRLYLN
jgi:hypothetical protein